MIGSRQNGEVVRVFRAGALTFFRFKLHLRAGHTQDSARVANEVPPLPLNKTVIEVFGDFIRYLMNCTVAYIRDTHPNSTQLWESLKANIAFVLSHPNGWEGFEQGKMRQAAVHASIIEDTEDGHAQVTFVTEGEASLHFAIEQGVFNGTDMKAGDGVVVVDAGGGTIDVSAYTYDRADPKRPEGQFIFSEAFIPQSYFQGSVFVTVRAMDYLRGTFSRDLQVHAENLLSAPCKLRLSNGHRVHREMF